jgi:hypothetical protein
MMEGEDRKRRHGGRAENEGSSIWFQVERVAGSFPDIASLGSVDVLDDVNVSATFGCLFVVSGESGEGAVSTVTRDQQPLYATLADGRS